jgi:hypothetical protein
MPFICNESGLRGPAHRNGGLARIAFVAGLLAAASLAGGMGAGGRFTLGPHEFASGGGRSVSSSYAVAGVTGVWQAGTSTSETYSVAGGFLEAAGDAGPTTPPCPTDVTGDGAVDGADLATLLGNWANAGVADFDRSGAVDGADLATLLGAWGPCPVS